MFVTVCPGSEWAWPNSYWLPKFTYPVFRLLADIIVWGKNRVNIEKIATIPGWIVS